MEDVFNDALDYLVSIDFVEITWDEHGNDYYRLTDAGKIAADLMNVFEENSDDGYQVC